MCVLVTFLNWQKTQRDSLQEACLGSWLIVFLPPRWGRHGGLSGSLLWKELAVQLVHTLGTGGGHHLQGPLPPERPSIQKFPPPPGTVSAAGEQVFKHTSPWVCTFYPNHRTPAQAPSKEGTL